jgi:hypothetical protein
MKFTRLVFSALVCSIFASALLAANNAPTETAVQSLGHVPLWFEPSSADTAHPTFAAKTKSHSIAIEHAGVTFRLQPAGDTQKSATAVELRFEHANEKATLQGEEKLAGISNYLLGRDAKLWRTQVPHFGKVRLSQLYAGTDVVFYADGQQLEYDVVLKPGADASKVVFDVNGARALHVNAQGDLEIETAAGTLVQALPKAYQIVASRKTPVSTQYKLLGNNRVGFAVGKYDLAQELTIDPVLRYSTVFGGTNIDVGNGVAVDSAGHAFVVATACSQDFPVTPGAVTTPRSDFLCGASVTKFDVNGSTLLYSTVIGDGATGDAIAVDSAGNAYITGETTSSTFPTTSGAFQTTCTPDTDTGLCGGAFVVKLNPTGSALVYSTYLDGSGEDHGFGIAVDSNNQAYVTGDTLSTDFPTTPSAFQTACKGAATGACSDAFVTKVNATGTQLMYSTYLGGSSGDQGNGIAVDSTGHAYVTGGTSSTDFPITTGTPHTVVEGQAFVTKLSADGHSLVYSRYLGGSDTDSGHGIAVDSNAHAVVTGETSSRDFPVRNAASPRCHDGGNGCADAFLTKLDTAGLIEWSTFVGGTSGEVGTGVAVGPDGSVYAAGHTFSADFPTTVEAFQRILGGGVDAYVVKFSPAGALKYASFLGGGGGELHPGIAVDRSSAAYVAGLANFEPPAGSRGFPTTPGAFSESPSQLGEGDVFLSKVISLCALRTTSPSVTICTPHASTTVHSPVEVMAGTNDSAAVKLTQVYLDGKKIYEAFLSAIDVKLPIPRGTHRLTVQAIDSGNVTFKQSINITVQ